VRMLCVHNIICMVSGKQPCCIAVSQLLVVLGSIPQNSDNGLVIKLM